MGASVSLIIIGLLIWFLLPMLFSSGKKRKSARKTATICKIVGLLFVFLGIYNMLKVLLSF